MIKRLLLICMITAIPHLARADTPCAQIGIERPLRSSLASAGFFANLRNSENSINYQMDMLMDHAKAELGQVAQREVPCSNTCAHPVLGIVFTSTPHLSLSEYDEQEKCQALLNQTTAQPIVYRSRIFEDSDAAKEWYNDLTQGDGADGEDLYARCDGSCSPSYSSFIYGLNGRLVITTSIICGHARDKDDAQYRLNSALKWQCPTGE